MGYKVCQNLRYICTISSIMPDELIYSEQDNVPVEMQLCGDVYDDVDEAYRSFLDRLNSRPQVCFVTKGYSQYRCTKGEPKGEPIYLETSAGRTVWDFIAEFFNLHRQYDCGHLCEMD